MHHFHSMRRRLFYQTCKQSSTFIPICALAYRCSSNQWTMWHDIVQTYFGFFHSSSAATVRSHPKTGLCSEMPSTRQVARWCSASLHRDRRNPGPGGMPQVSLMSVHFVNRPWIFGLPTAGRLPCQAVLTYQNTEHSSWVHAKWTTSVHFLFQQWSLRGHHALLFISSHLYKSLTW